jgi:hypothetical protein
MRKKEGNTRKKIQSKPIETPSRLRTWSVWEVATNLGGWIQATRAWLEPPTTMTTTIREGREGRCCLLRLRGREREEEEELVVEERKKENGSGPGGRKRLRPACADPLNISAPRTATPFLRLLSPHSVFFVNLFLSNKVGSAASC